MHSKCIITVKCLKCREYPQHRTPAYCESGSIRSTIVDLETLQVVTVSAVPKAKTLGVHEVSAVVNLETLRVIAVSAAPKAQILRVHEVPAVIFIEQLITATPARVCAYVRTTWMHFFFAFNGISRIVHGFSNGPEGGKHITAVVVVSG